MHQKLVYPQEIEVWYILPAIRRELAAAMSSKGLQQKEIAAIMGVTEAAVSQYMNSKRALEIKFNEKLNADIAKAAGRIMADNDLIMQETQRLVNGAWQERHVCKLCNEHNNTPKSCGVCFV